jgi:nitrite reductase/ring-hydroxylating ferredoxin subunit
MPEFVTVASTNDIPPGEMMVVDVNGTEIAIANCDGEYFAINNSCTHRGGPLGEGLMLPGCIVECPFHGGQFNIRTGEVIASPPDEPVATYPVQLEGENIRVAVG